MPPRILFPGAAQQGVAPSPLPQAQIQGRRLPLPVVIVLAANAAGALPVSFTFASTGQPLVGLIGAGGFAGAAGLITVNINMDGSNFDSMSFFCNAANTHEAFTPHVITRTGLAPGTHTLQLSAGAGISTDANDHFFALLAEDPTGSFQALA